VTASTTTLPNLDVQSGLLRASLAGTCDEANARDEPPEHTVLVGPLHSFGPDDALAGNGIAWSTVVSCLEATD